MNIQSYLFVSDLKKFTEQFDETKLKENVMKKKKGSESGNPADLFCVSRNDGDDVMCGSSSSAPPLQL